MTVRTTFLKRGLLVTALITLMVPVLCTAALYISARYQRLRAEQLFSAVRQLEPGVTTRTEYIQVIQPFLSYVSMNGNDGDSFGIANQPDRVFNALSLLPTPVLSRLQSWPVTEGVLFWVLASFDNDKLSAITFMEHHGSGHPGGASVEIREGRVDCWLEQKFSGYEAQEMHLDDDDVPWSSHVHMDDRATPDQRKRAMDFKFECFTAFQNCGDSRRILNPVITR